MSKLARENLFIGIIVSVAILDISLTAAGQPGGYWIGNASPNEANLMARFFMEIHPVAWFLFSVIYISGIVVLIKKILVSYFRLVVGIGLFLGHGICFIEWVRGERFPVSDLLLIYVPTLIFFCILAANLAYRSRNSFLLKEVVVNK